MSHARGRRGGRWAGACLAGWLGLAVCFTQGAQVPILEVREVTPLATRLRARGVEGSDLRLEGSLDLRRWFYLDSQPATSGVAEFVHDREWPWMEFFYRAVESDPPIQVPVSPLVDTNLVAGALMTPEDGGRMSLELPGEVQVELIAEPGLVREPVAVRMVAVTNFTAFPTDDGHRAAVTLQPDGLEFLGEAQLRIRFPEELPWQDMLAYSFGGDGSGFHLVESRPGSHEVVVRLSHFSGAGVARFGTAPGPFDRAWDGSREAVRAASDRAARRDREIWRDEWAGRITPEEARRREGLNRLQKYEEIYQDAVRPYENAAATDCAIGSAVVLSELESLSRLWRETTGGSAAGNPYRGRISEIAPRVRCACARALIHRCENDPSATGSSLLDALDSLLLDARVATGRTDGQGCDLGSDEEIRQRLLAGPCFRAWEGRITLTRIKRQKGDGSIGDQAQTWDNETREIYVGSVTEVASESSFTRDGKPATAWLLKTAGTVYFGHRLSETSVFDSPSSDIVITTRTKESTSDSTPGAGEIHLTITDGEFDGLGAGGGNASSVYRHFFSHREETTYRCKVPFPPNNPCPPPDLYASTRNVSYFQGYAVDKNDPLVSVTVDDRVVNLTWRKVREFPNTFGPSEVVEERIWMSLVRVRRDG